MLVATYRTVSRAPCQVVTGISVGCTAVYVAGELIENDDQCERSFSARLPVIERPVSRCIQQVPEAMPDLSIDFRSGAVPERVTLERGYRALAAAAQPVVDNR